MDFTSSAMRDFVDLAEDDDDEEKDEEQEKVDELESPKPAEKAKSKAKSCSNRRKTAGDELEAEEMPPRSKRRRTLGDSPNPSVSNSFHTQTLTQMLSTNDRNEDPWQVIDSQEDEDLGLVVETPRKRSASRLANELHDGPGSTVPSLIKSVTPVNRQKKTEIPSSQSPATPMLLRYSPAPQQSPLMSRSSNVAAPSPILKRPGIIPRNAVIPDSYGSTHDSSPVPTPKSTVKATPSKRLRFALPEDKENITPGRTKPKSPKPKAQSTGRRPLQEVPDSDEDLDEDLDETEYETEGEEDGAQDPESPTPKRFRSQNVVPPVEDAELESELGSSENTHCPLEGETEPAILTGSQLLNDELGLEPCDQPRPITGPEPTESAKPTPMERDFHPNQPMTVNDDAGEAKQPETLTRTLSSSHERGPERDIEVEVETIQPTGAEQVIINSAPASVVGRTPEPTSPEQAKDNDDEVDDTSPSTQGFSYTQGLESQRLPLDVILSLGPQTPNSDIMVSLHPEHIAKIVDRSKNHEFRAWKIPLQVARIWIYITRPESQLKYMCIFGEPKTHGEIEDEKGIGNVEFNQRRTAAKYAYEILEVYELNNPVPLEEMKRNGWVAGAPQKYTYIPPAVVGELTANLRCALFGETTQSQTSPRADVSEAQELKAQLQSDADYSTQHYSELTDEVVPASQSPRRNSADTAAVIDKRDFVRPTLPRVRSIASNQGSPQLPSQRQRSVVRPSQATTVSQVSSSPAMSPEKSGPSPILISSQTGNSSPTLLRRNHSSLRSSQFPTRSQMLPDSLLNDDICEPPPIIWDSADEHSD
jgi:predicted transcriptional regulator